MKHSPLIRPDVIRPELPLSMPDHVDSPARKKQVWVMFCLMACLSVTVLPLGNLASAHSGGTNKYGCHAGSKPYHCH